MSKINQKNLIIGGAVVVILVAVVILLMSNKEEVADNGNEVIVDGQKDNKSQQEQQENQKDSVIEEIYSYDNTENWNIFESEGWGFRIKYPKNLYIKPYAQSGKYPGDPNFKIAGETQEQGQILIISDQQDMGIQDVLSSENIHIVVQVIKNEKNESLEEYLRRVSERHYGYFDKNYKKYKFNNEEVFCFNLSNQYKSQNSMSIELAKENLIYSLYVELNGKLNSDIEDNMLLKKKNYEIAKNIISTFEFIEK